MALTKSRTSIWSSQTLTAGAGDTTSSAQNLTAVYESQVDIKITNGATGPTIPAQCQIKVAADSGGTLYVNFGGPLVSNTGNNTVTSWSIDIPIGVASLELVAGSNTAQNVTIDADISTVTAI